METCKRSSTRMRFLASLPSFGVYLSKRKGRKRVAQGMRKSYRRKLKEARLWLRGRAARRAT